MKNRMKKVRVTNGKLVVTKSFHWKLFGVLLQDLGCTPDAKGLPFSVVDRSTTEMAKAIYKVVRSRDEEGLRQFLSSYDTQRNVVESDNAEDFFVRHQLVSFLKKYPLKGGSAARDKAISSFLAAENTCRLFNKENCKGLIALNRSHPDFFEIIEELQDEVEDLLGVLPPLEKINGMASHGPGTTVCKEQHGEGRSTDFYKWSVLPYSVTTDCLPYARQAILDDPRWIGALDDWYRRVHLGGNYTCIVDQDDFWSKVFRIVYHSRYATVPKTAETDRSICIEPTLNVLLQLGVDGFIRGRLKRRWGIDLNSQEVNQNLAYEGSVTGELATLDLKGASDSITLFICWLLLPPAWYALLCSLRCKTTVMKLKVGGIDVEKAIHLAKISSMGNGYTFALESLIFAALARVAMRRTKSSGHMSIYGDDIIVPVTAVPFLTELLSLCGFTLNKDKSFSSGPFRESCGKDYYKGTLVRPVFLHKVPNHVQDIFHIHNAFFALRDRLPWSFGFSFERTLAYLRSLLPSWVNRSFEGPAGENTNTHLFSSSRIGFFRSEKTGAWAHHVLRAHSPREKWRYKDYFFIKLMSNLAAKTGIEYKWDVKRKGQGGNAFVITKRDRVQYVRAEQIIYDGCMCSRSLSYLQP